MTNRKLFIGLLVLCSMISCKHKESEYHSLTDKIKEEGKKYKGDHIPEDIYLGDAELMEITEGAHTFLIPERKSQIASYACTECHNKSLEELGSEVRLKRAHWDIELVHADEIMMNCTTCHNTSNMDNLNTLLGKEVDYNNSFKLCAQCHTNQYESWLGGAHGKNIGGWTPPRAAMTCVNCHNPHQPQIESRWPVIFNTRIAKERE